jgi:hypothetical protein
MNGPYRNYLIASFMDSLLPFATLSTKFGYPIFRSKATGLFQPNTILKERVNFAYREKGCPFKSQIEVLEQPSMLQHFLFGTHDLDGHTSRSWQFR